MRSSMQKALDQMNLYWENKVASFFAVKGVVVPTGCERLPRRTLLYGAGQAYPKLIHFNKLPKGRHFAAREQPKLF